MIKIFIDTNIWLRYLAADDQVKYTFCQKLIGLNEEGKIRVYTSAIVLLELAYTLRTFYKAKHERIVKEIEGILSGRNLTLIEKTDLLEALKIFKKFNLKLADALIAKQIIKGMILCTYDHDFKRIKGLDSLTPEEILDKIKANE